MIPMDSHPTASAATSLPFDVLQEIFFHCLPDSPLDEAQPNTKIAPMLLCHVCSSWRTTALESPGLWTYLYYRLPLLWYWDNGTAPPIAWDSKIFLRDKECLRWWRRNQGSKAPFIRLECYQPKKVTSTQSQELHLTHEDMTQFFAEYLSSAQYLDIPDFALYVPQQKSTSSSEVSYSNLQSLATSYPESDERIVWPPLPAFGLTLKPISLFDIFPNLRRLRLHRCRPKPDLTTGFARWSGLTHLALHNMSMHPDVWFCLIRGVPNLQWGYFEMLLHSTAETDPPMFTLPYLDTLSVALDCDIREGDRFSQLFTNLHLPALRDLSIYTDADRPENLPGAAMKINAALKCAPAVRKLTLAFVLLRYVGKHTVRNTNWDAVDKLPVVAPDLAHLVLDMCNVCRDFEFEYRVTLSRRLGYLTQLLRPRCWLDLDSPASALRKISVVVMNPSREGEWVEGAIRGALELEEAGHDEETNVVLEIIPEDERGLAPYAEGYKTWGCSF